MNTMNLGVACALTFSLALSLVGWEAQALQPPAGQVTSYDGQPTDLKIQGTRAFLREFGFTRLEDAVRKEVEVNGVKKTVKEFFEDTDECSFYYHQRTGWGDELLSSVWLDWTAYAPDSIDDNRSPHLWPNGAQFPSVGLETFKAIFVNGEAFAETGSTPVFEKENASIRLAKETDEKGDEIFKVELQTARSESMMGGDIVNRAIFLLKKVESPSPSTDTTLKPVKLFISKEFAPQDGNERYWAQTETTCNFVAE